MTVRRPRGKPGRASLIGGIVVGIACFVTWAAVARDLAADTPASLAVGLAVSAAIAAWIRAADL